MPRKEIYVFQPHVRTFFWSDTSYYLKNKEAILKWAKDHKCKVPSKRYGWITCQDDRTVILFILTWPRYRE